MFKVFQYLFLSAALLGTGSASAQIDKATAESLIRKSGLWEQLDSIAAQTEASLPQIFAQSGTKPGAEELARLGRAIRESYSADRLRRVSVDLVAKKLNARHVAALQRWYDSPIGQTITGLEEKSSADPADPQAQMQQGVALLKNSPPARRRMLEELLKESRAAEAAVQVTINTSLAAYRGVASVSPNAPGMSAAELKAALEAQRPQMMQGFSAMILAGFARAYEQLPTESLQSYVTFLRSEAGSHFNALGIEALDAALTEAAAEFGRRVPSTKDRANT